MRRIVMVMALASSTVTQALEVRESSAGGETVRWFDEMVPMADGVKLYTYGHAPPPGEKCAIVVMRTPYVKEARVDMEKYARGQNRVLKRGYAYVRQHCRGRGMSEGNCIPYKDERSDGLALLDWVRRLSWFNGEIYIEGGSYNASVHWAYLDTNPADVKGAFLTIQEVDRYNVCYRNGFFKIGLHGNWFPKQYYNKDHALTRNPDVRLTDLPLIDFSARFWGRPEPAFDNVVAHPDPSDPFWRSAAPGSGAEYRNAFINSMMPILLKTGFYDIYTEGVCDMWREVSAARRSNCALLIDAFDHGGKLNDALKGTKGEFPGGARSDERVEALDWFDAIRAAAKDGKPFTGVEGAPANHTRYYALWENKWHTEPSLTNGMREVKFTLGEKKSSYVYDPRATPPPFPGSGGICFGGMQAQPSLHGRTDAVTFALAPLEERLDVRGRMEMALAVASDCEDTAFYVRLSVDKGDGRWYLLRDDITSISFEARGKAQRAYMPGEKRVISYRFPDHAFRLEKGDRLRVDVASANSFFAAHTNVKGDQFRIKNVKLANNTVFASESTLTIFALPSAGGCRARLGGELRTVTVEYANDFAVKLTDGGALAEHVQQH